MKRLIKYTLLPGICCLILGILIAGVLFLGYKDEVLAHQDEFSINADNFREFFEVEEQFSITRAGKHYGEDETKESYSFTVPAGETIDTLRFAFAVGDIEIVSGDRMEVFVTDMFAGAITSECKNGTWYIQDSLIDSGSVHSGYSPNVRITLPGDEVFQKVEIDVNAGELQVEELCGENISLSVDAGSIKVFGLTATESLALNNGVGEMRIYDMNVCNLVADNGVGMMQLTGAITGKNSITCGIGEVDVTLTGRNGQDFDYSVDCGIGEVEVNGVQYKGTTAFSESSHGRGHHDNTDHFKLDCGIGRISLEIKR